MNRSVINSASPYRGFVTADELADDDEQVSLLMDDSVLEEVNEPPEVNTSLEENKYMIGGCIVKFPYKAYEIQNDMMEKVITGAENEENCLLESPTGTGKTASLLCALLAWQSKFEEDEKERLCKEEQDEGDDEDNENNMLPSPVKISKPGSPPRCFAFKKEMPEERRHLPIIIFATRTHSQIKGVVKQLGLTKYKNVPMAILASRKQCCINQVALDSKSVDTTCQVFRNNYHGRNSGSDWTDEKIENAKTSDENAKVTCKFYDGPLEESSFTKAEEENYDIEDLKEHSRSCGSCPYQELRALQQRAKIIFCTYNHLLHKQIRNALKIEVEGNICVFDEAHNIEDVCRSLASLRDKALSINRVQDILIKFTEAHDGPNPPPGEKYNALVRLKLAFQRLEKWLLDQLKPDAPGYTLTSGRNSSQKEFKRDISSTLIHELSEIQFGPDQITKLWSDWFILEDKHYTIKPEENERPFRVDPDTMNTVSKILFGFSKCFKKDPVSGEFLYWNDYVKLLTKTRPAPTHTSSAFGFGQQSTQPQLDKDIELSLICLNPAVIFQEMSSARSIIVTSGTLSPIDSFSTELNTVFHHQLSAKHVIATDRIFASIITSSLQTDRLLNFTYKNCQDDLIFGDYQKQLFIMLSTLSGEIPHGILVFFGSKRALTQLHSRWARNGNLKQLQNITDTFFEHEYCTNDKFNEMMKSYKEKVRHPRGAILFAVLRGKVSEGVDFKDNQARAVLTVGIPFLPYNSEEIKAKMKYNDDRANEAGSNYLSGRDWYNASAFRALNQAFGRCVRHVNDWGTILIVDSRFVQANHKNALSNWVKDSINTPTRVTQGPLEHVLPSLQIFLQPFL